MIQIHPIRCPSVFKKNLFGGRSGVDRGAAISSPSQNHFYCRKNPCIDRKVHELHMQVLNGVENAEHELNRYLLVCGMLENCDTGEDSSASSLGKAHIVWVCDICNSGNHNVSMHRDQYRQQYRAWKAPSFCSKGTPLRLPISDCLVTPSECTMHYELLPDLGPFFRNMLQRFYYTECSRKMMMKSIKASVGNSNGWGSSSNEPTSSYKIFDIWNAMMHGVCIGLLLESIPCMKRSKRNRSLFADSSGDSSLAEVMACINVMHGTLLKLYPMGAKTPTFKTRFDFLCMALYFFMYGSDRLAAQDEHHLEDAPAHVLLQYKERPSPFHEPVSLAHEDMLHGILCECTLQLASRGERSTVRVSCLLVPQVCHADLLQHCGCHLRPFQAGLHSHGKGELGLHQCVCSCLHRQMHSGLQVQDIQDARTHRQGPSHPD
jgi:hypothetical protein